MNKQRMKEARRAIAASLGTRALWAADQALNAGYRGDRAEAMAIGTGLSWDEFGEAWEAIAAGQPVDALARGWSDAKRATIALWVLVASTGHFDGAAPGPVQSA